MEALRVCIILCVYAIIASWELCVYAITETWHTRKAPRDRAVSVVPQQRRVLKSIRAVPGSLGTAKTHWTARRLRGSSVDSKNYMYSSPPDTATVLAPQALCICLLSVVAAAMLQSHDLEEALAHYGSYHQDPVNKAIHFVFVPTIWWSCCILLAYVPLPGAHRSRVHRPEFCPTWAAVQLGAYVAYYLVLQPSCGVVYAPFLLGMYAHATHNVTHELSSPHKHGEWRWWQKAALAQVVAWWAQIHPGHMIAEGVKPALLDSFGHSLSVAPLFAFLEGAWALGFQPQMHQEVLSYVHAERQQMCQMSNHSYHWCRTTE